MALNQPFGRYTSLRTCKSHRLVPHSIRSRGSCHRNWATKSHFFKNLLVDGSIIFGCTSGVLTWQNSELGAPGNRKGTWLAQMDPHFLSATIIPASCFFSSGNAGLSFVNKISGLITALQVTGRRPHHCWKAWAAMVAGGAHREPALSQDTKPISQVQQPRKPRPSGK